MSLNSLENEYVDESSLLPPPSPPASAVAARSIPNGRCATTSLSAEPNVEWSSGIFDCFSDWTNCCITCWCPCVTFGQIAEIVDRGSSSCVLSGAVYTCVLSILVGCPYLYSCFYRTKMRQQYNLKEGPCCDDACDDDACGDCLLHCFCEQCALCQEYRELQSRGYDMSIGWQANAERKREMGMSRVEAPVAQEDMRR